MIQALTNGGTVVEPTGFSYNIGLFDIGKLECTDTLLSLSYMNGTEIKNVSYRLVAYILKNIMKFNGFTINNKLENYKFGDNYGGT